MMNVSNDAALSDDSTGSDWLVKGLVLGGLVMVVGVLYLLFRDDLTLRAIAAREQQLRAFRDSQPVLVYVLAFLLYVVVTGLSLPGAAVLSLAYGWYFDFWPAVVLVSFASTTGATVAFLLSRYLFRDAFRRRFGERMEAFERNLAREGAFYLFSLRLVPAVPFFVLNVVMALTPIAVGTFWWVSQLGMLPATMVFVYAGSTIPSLDQLADPNQLRPDEVRDWPRLVAMLDRASRDDGPATARRLWAVLPDETRDVVENAAGQGDVAEAARTAIVDGLNEVVTRRDFALAEPWSELQYEREPAEGDANAVERTHLTKINRAVLVAAFPGLIGPSQPILSWQLIGAFVLLGVFPLAVKKGVGWWKGVPGEEGSEAKANGETETGDVAAERR
jgi:uncharacterized membrane protein YdjX (TVP38/TMEM64 family)